MRRVRVLGTIVFSLLLGAFLTQNTYAVDFGSVKTKAALEGVYQCFKNGAFRTPFNSDNWKNEIILKGEEDHVKLPYGLTDATDNNTNCKQILFGFSTNIDGDNLNKGLMSNIKDSTDKEKVKNYLSGNDGAGGEGTMGYKAEKSGDVSDGAKAYQLKISVSQDIVCRNSDGELMNRKFILSDGTELDTLVFPALTVNENAKDFLKTDKFRINMEGVNVPEPGSGDTLSFDVCERKGIILSDYGDSKGSVYYGWNENGRIIPNVENGNYLDGATLNIEPDNGWYEFVQEEIDITDTGNYDSYTFSYNRNTSSIKGMVSKLSQANDIGYNMGALEEYADLALSPQEVYNLYTYYVKTVYEYPVACEGEDNYEAFARATEIKWSKDKTCMIDLNYTGAANPTNLYGVDGDNHFTKPININDIIDTLKDLDLSKLDTDNAGTGATGTETPQDAESDPCIENAASLGWVVCPLMNKIAEALDGLYDQIIEPFLIVNPSLLDPDNGTWKAWSIMVNIANILLVIFLLVVIFSQITGVGITNYGIKKSLPKIFIAAILINLSFIICQLAVDISNILGNSLNKVLTDIGTEIPIDLPDGAIAETGDQASWFKGLLTLGAGGIVGIGAISIVQETLFGGGIISGMVLPALLLFVIAIVSIIFFFIILGVRKAGVVIFVVLSPLAFVCYMLPNTKKYFDKWLDGFKALLLVYPICGLLLGGSYLTSRILLQTSTDFIMYFAGSMMMIVPFFFIPSLLKGSLRAMGDLGTKLSSLGKNLGTRSSNRLGNTIKNSRGYQERVKQNQERAAANRARRIHAKLANKDRDSLTWRDKMRAASASDAIEAYEAGQFKGEVKASSSNLRQAIAKQRFDINEGAKDLEKYDNNRYIDAATTKNQLSREHELESTLLYNRDGFPTAKQRQYASQRDNEIYKMHTDRHATLTRRQMEAELRDAISDYNTSRSHDNRIKLQAALASAEGSGMNKEMLNGMHTLTLNAENEEDASILKQLSSSSDKVLSQFGNQVTKNTENMSLDSFVRGNVSPTVNLQSALNAIGPNGLVGQNDDTLEYIRRNNPKAVDSEQLKRAALNASDNKQLEQINQMYRSMDADTIKFSGDELARFDPSTVGVLEGMSAHNPALIDQFINASNKIAASPEKNAALHSDVRAAINRIRTMAGYPAI